MSPWRPESREETPKEGIRRSLAAALRYFYAGQNAMGKSPKRPQKLQMEN